MIAFSAASAFAHIYPDKPWVGAIGYTGATLVGLERMWDNDHFASDVFVGATIGYFVGKFIASRHSETQDGSGIQPVDGFLRRDKGRHDRRQSAA